MKLKLTTASIRSTCKPPTPDELTSSGKPVRQRAYWDTDEPGFGLIVRPRSSTFVYQRDLNGRTIKVTIGKFGRWTPEQARKRARELAVEMDKGTNPNAERKEQRARQVTLAEAMAMHLDDMRASDCSPRSIEVVRYEIDLHLKDWLTRPLVEITGDDCRKRHRRLTDGSGPYAANRALRHFRACYNTAARVHNEALPHRCPTAAVKFNKERRRQEPIEWDKLPAWWKQVSAYGDPARDPNPRHRTVHRDLQFFLLLTGLRATDGSTVKWSEINFEAGTIFRPKPKGGEDRAFTVPLATWVLDLLKARREQNKLDHSEGDGGWVFPSARREGGIGPVRSPRIQSYDSNGKRVETLPSPHRLRDTFITAAHEAFLREFDIKLLVNHALPGDDDVTAGYIRPSIEHLRTCVEKVVEFLLVKAGVKVAEAETRDAG